LNSLKNSRGKKTERETAWKKERNRGGERKREKKETVWDKERDGLFL
jgi:hypothetical protein